jgi:molybdenum cofactor biosynthesis enzyme MoaA
VISGFVKQLLPEEIRGWAFDRERPSHHLVVDIYHAERHVGTTIANRYHRLLALNRIGTGDHSFLFSFPERLDREQLTHVVARARGESDDPSISEELPHRIGDERLGAYPPSNATTSAGENANPTGVVPEFLLNVWNIASMVDRAPRTFGAIRFDSNNNCNVHCVYCHNFRSEELVDTADFRAFLSTAVVSVDDFQIGCGMEPTLDPRLCDFMDIVAGSPVRPRRHFRLQTNGILLHRHDHGRMRAAGLTHLSVSVDSPQASTHKDLRGGTSLAKVERNLRAFHAACPSVRMVFLTTVTSANIGSLRELVTWGMDVGAAEFVFRQMFYRPDSLLVDHSRMPALLVKAEEFAQCKRSIIAEFAPRARIVFLEDSTLVRGAARTMAASEMRARS